MTDRATIFALSSAPGRAGVAVVRLSGPRAGEVLDRLAGPRPAPRRATLRPIRDPTTSALIDRVLLLWLPGPASFTGEDMAELHLHGSRAVLAALFIALAREPACRPAEPGEFARRAFDSGRIDLAEAEGLADLIDAETEAQRRQALAQADGALSRLYESWRARLIEATALAEAAIDFSDEADVSARALADARDSAAALRQAITGHLDDGRRGEILREGFRVVLAGPPNVGKSSLINALARRDVAIVSAEPGTTRDAIEVRLDLVGLPVIVTDTAGLRDTVSDIEREGIRRTLRSAADADLVVWIEDASAAAPTPPDGDLAAGPARLLRVANKSDAARSDPARPGLSPPLRVSALTGEGLPQLVSALAAAARDRLGDGEQAAHHTPALTQARHRHLLEACRDALDAMLAGDPDAAELRADDLRLAAAALGRITGRIDPEHILDQVFARFCIGK